MTAEEILRKGLETLAERGKQYGDGQPGARNMADIVAIFNAATGHKLSVREGWLFMVALKLKRAASGGVDSFVDGANYFALAGEEVSRDPPIAPVSRSLACPYCKPDAVSVQQVRTYCCGCVHLGQQPPARCPTHDRVAQV